MRRRPSRRKLTSRRCAMASRKMLSIDRLRGANTAAHGSLESRRIFRVRVVAGERDAIECSGHRLDAGRAGDRGALLGDDARPLRLADAWQRSRELAMAALGDLVERHLLVIALGADDAGEAAFLAEQRTAVEHPLHQADG